jgi:hypothetical protein
VENRDDDYTAPVTEAAFDPGLTDGDLETSALTGDTMGGSLTDAIGSVTDYTLEDDGDEKTMGYYDQSLGMEPVVGWMVCIFGSNLGQDWRLTSGRNFIGRGPDQDVSVPDDATVSRDRHCIISYDAKTNVFQVQAGESKALAYLNDAVVLNAVEIKEHDVLTVGATKLMFFPACDGVFSWEKLGV